MLKVVQAAAVVSAAPLVTCTFHATDERCSSGNATAFTPYRSQAEQQRAPVRRQQPRLPEQAARVLDGVESISLFA